MGIKNLSQLLTLKCPECVVKKNLKEYSGKMLAIDVSIYLYKYKYNNDDHIEGLTRQVLRLLKNGITPLYIFDGEPPEEKDEVIKERIDRRNANRDKQKELEKNLIEHEACIYTTDEEIKQQKKKSAELKIEIDKIKKRIIKITKEDTELAKKLFDIMGVPYIISNGEAECLCAVLCKNGIVDGCISDDTDILANGGTKFIRNFNASTNYIMEYSLDVILSKLDVSYDQFLDICIMCGCDYTGKIHGIGPINAYKFVKKFNSLENVVKIINNKSEKCLKKFNVPPDFKFATAKQLFIDTCNIDTTKYEKVCINKPHINTLIDFLKKSAPNLHKKYFDEINKSLFNYYSNNF